jgi:multidrug resistance efflux pump
MDELAQQSVILRIQTEQREAERQAQTGKLLAERGLLASLELRRREERAVELKNQLALERDRSRALEGSIEARIQATSKKVERMRDLARYRAQQLDALRVVAPVEGVLQEIPIELGQQLTAGTPLAKISRPEDLMAQLRISQVDARGIAVGQTTRIDTRGGVVAGHVVRIDPVVQQGNVPIDIAFDEPLPSGTRSEQNVEGRIVLDTLEDVLILRRPAFGQPESAMQLFVLDSSGRYAERRTVRLGPGSVTEVAVYDGLRETEQVILSDMSRWETVDRVRLY